MQERDKIGSWICIGAPFRSMVGPPFQPIFSRAGSTQLTEHSRKVLLGFEAAGHGDIQDTRLGRAQHLLRALYSVAQYKLVRRLACRLAKHPGKMSWAQIHRLRHLPKRQICLAVQFPVHNIIQSIRPTATVRDTSSHPPCTLLILSGRKAGADKFNQSSKQGH